MKVVALLKRIPFGWLIGGLVLLYLLPIWAFHYLPTQDGPSHLYNSFVIRQFWNPAYDFQQYYTLRAGVIPNLAAHAILAILMLVCPPLIAEKILASAYVVFFVSSLLYFQGAIRPGRKIISLLTLFLVYNYPFLMGFYSFAIGVPLYALTVGYWWKHKERLNWGAAAIINVLLFAAFFAHVFPYISAVCSILFLAGVLYRARPRMVLWSSVCVVPSLAVFLYWILNVNNPTAETIGPNWSGVLQRLWELTGMSTLVSYNGNQQSLAYAFLILLVAMVTYTLRDRFRAFRLKGGGSFEPRDALGFLFLALIAAYLVSPPQVGSFGWTNDRLLLLALVVLLAWIGDIRDKAWGTVLGAMVVGILLANLVVLADDFRRLNGALEHFTAGVREVGPDEVLLPVLLGGSEGSGKVGIFVNAADYYALGNGNVNIADYEAYFDVFPLAIRKDLLRPINSEDPLLRLRGEPQLIDFCRLTGEVDVVLVWREKGGDIPASLAKCYRQVYENAGSQLLLYRLPQHGSRGQTLERPAP